MYDLTLIDWKQYPSVPKAKTKKKRKKKLKKATFNVKLETEKFLAWRKELRACSLVG